MSWIILAIIPQILWSFSNIIDEYLSRHHLNDAYFMVILASLLQFIPGLSMFLFRPDMLDLPFYSILILCALGAFIMLNFIPYIRAIQIDGAGVAVPLYQMIPIFTFILAWIFLGETIEIIDLIAAGLIISASIGMTWDFRTKSISTKTFYLMLLSCLGWGVYNVTNRYFLEDINWLVVLAWMWIGSGIYACGAFLLQPNQRAMMIDVLQKTDARRILSLFIVQALLDILAFSCFIKALQQAPVAGLVPTIGGTQAFFIFLIAGVFGYFFPSTFYKTKSSSIMIWRLLCIVVLFIGVMILSLL